MARNPTRAQRLEWHIEHAQECHCRAVTPKLQAEIDEYLRERARAQ
jgi:hypothetical protein